MENNNTAIIDVSGVAEALKGLGQSQPTPLINQPDDLGLDLSVLDEDTRKRGVMSDMALQALGGARDAVQSGVVDIAAAPVDSLTKAIGDVRWDKDGIHVYRGWMLGGDGQAPAFQSPQLPAVDPADTTAGRITHGVSQFVTGFIGSGKLLKTVGWAKGGLAKAATQGAVTDFAAFDGHEARLSNLINEEFPSLANPVTDFLAARPEDSQASGRFKNALEGLALGAAMEPFVALVGAVKRGRAAAKLGDVEGVKNAVIDGADQAAELEKTGTHAQTQAAQVANAQLKALSEAPPPKPEEITAREVKPGEQLDLFPGSLPAKPQGVEEAAAKAGVEPPTPILFMTAEQVGRLKEAVTHRFMHGADLANTTMDFNMKPLLSGEDPKAAINLMSEVIKGQITELKGGVDGVQTWKMVEEQADILGTNATEMYGRLSKTYASMEDLAATVTAGKTMLQGIANHALKLADKDAAGQLTAQEAVELTQTMHLWANVQAMQKGIQTNIARAQNAQKIMRDLSANQFKDVDFAEILAGAGGDAAVKKLATKLRAARDNPKALNKLAGGSLLGKVWDVHNEYWINAILSGPKTHAVNMLSNAVNTMALPAERMLAGAFRGDVAAVRDGGRMYVNLGESFLDSVQAASKAFTLNESVLDPTMLKDGLSRHAIEMGNGAVLQNLQQGNFVAAVINGFGKVVNMPTRFLLAEDEFFKQLNYRANLRNEAWREAADKGLSGSELAAHIADVLDRGFTDTGAAAASSMGKRSLQYAREATFQQDLGESLGRDIQTMVNRHPGLRVVMPFVKTPTNIMRSVWQRTPGVNMLQAQYRADMMGVNGTERQAMAAAKMTTGAALWGSAGYLAANGMITGNGPADPELKKNLKATGWQPYSFAVAKEHVPDSVLSAEGVSPGKDGLVYISFQRFDPLGMFLGLAADYAEVSGHMDEQTAGDFAGAMVASLVHNLSSKTYLKSLVDTLDVISQPDRKLEKWWYRQAGSYIPSVVANFKGDEYLREVRSTLDAFKARLPGYSSEVDPQRNAFGEAIQAPAGFGIDTLSPFALSEYKGEKAADELARMDHAFTFPPKKVGNVNLAQFRSDATGKSAYDRWQELSGTLQYTGKTMKEALETVIESPRYATASDGVKSDGEKFEGTRLDILRAVMGGYRIMALEELKKELPSLDAAIRADQKKSLDVKKFGPSALIR